jgi:hypothetical protein
MNVLLFIALAFPLGVRDSNLLSGSARYRDAGRRDPGGRRNQGEHGAKLAAILVGIRSAREAG